ncbi:MAG: ATP synthase F1 subunit gamma [Candidatus Levybacteria bacterium RIFCSPLOWO2_02_FULL_36_8b]|nr:MAG: ATP synthase F1 subunit gamma [Candidatus Levybacteria bacterium RIFCSPLOWO2_02_FULL_36_8b]
MANTLLLKRRIKTAQNVSKTTRAMQMIAASKLKRAQEVALGSRPYVEKLSLLAKKLSSKIDREELHPYMKSNSSDTTLLIIFSPDKGLCGGLVTNLLRELLSFEKNNNFTFLTIGKKMENNVLRLRKTLIASFPFGNTLPVLEMIYPIERIINDYFLNGKVNSVKVLSTHFSSFFSQVPKIETILPLAFDYDSKTKESVSKDQAEFEMFEPKIGVLLPSLLEHYLQMSIYQHLLESFLSEQAARMFAMQNATDNAKDIIMELQLDYNKQRQEKITNEILDISSGALV